MTLHRSRAQAGEALFDHVQAGTTQQADSVLPVPVGAFFDEGRWTLEIERIFKALPLVLGWSAEMPNPGDYKTMEVVGLPLLLTRGADGEVRVFLNVCTHRGGLLATQGRGTCSRFSCSYHGWTFANDGRLIGVADKAKFGDLDETGRGLRRLPSAERGGVIFAVLDPDASIDVDQYYGAMLSEIETMGLGGWAYLGMRELPSPNWKIAFDGYIENYHFATTHAETIAPYVISDVMTFDTFGPHIRVGAPSTSILPRLRAVPRDRWDGFENDGYEFVRALFPNTTLTFRPELTHLTIIIPGPTPAESRTLLIFIRPAAPIGEDERAAAEQMMDSIANILRTEDYRTNFDLQKGLRSGALDTVVFGRNEAANQFFHKCTDYYVRGAEAAFPRL